MLVRQSTQTKNKMAGMLMEAGVPYDKRQLHNSKKYFEELLDLKASMMPDALPGLLRLGRNVIDVLRSMNRQLVHMLENDCVLAERIARLTSIPGVRVILALRGLSKLAMSRVSPLRKRLSATAVCAAPSKVRRASRKGRRYRSSEISICNHAHRSRQSRSELASGICFTL